MQKIAGYPEVDSRAACAWRWRYEREALGRAMPGGRGGTTRAFDAEYFEGMMGGLKQLLEPERQANRLCRYVCHLEPVDFACLARFALT